jgi:hypothetical protein
VWMLRAMSKQNTGSIVRVETFASSIQDTCVLANHCGTRDRLLDFEVYVHPLSGMATLRAVVV